MKNKKATEHLAISKILILVLIILAVVLLFFFWKRQDIWTYIKSLPGWSSEQNDSEIDYSKLSADELAKYECKAVGKIVYSSSVASPNYYIFIGNKQTNLYIQDYAIFSYIGKTDLIKNIGGFGEPALVGGIKDNIIKINPGYLDETSQDYLKYKEYLPSELEMRIINGAFMLGSNLLCKKEEQISDIKKEESCFETCELHNGICKENGNIDEISFGKINCKNNEQCFVKKIEQKTEDGELSLIDFSSVYINPQMSPPGFVFLRTNVSTVQVGERQILSFIAYYPRQDSSDFGKKANGYCYMFRTNDRTLKSGYNKNEINNGEKVSSYASFENTENTLELVIWDSGKKVIKRINIKAMLNMDFFQLIPVLNEKFKEEIMKKSDGNYYVVDAAFKFPDGRVVSSYKIEKSSNKIVIYGYYAVGDGKQQWYEIDCYTGFGGFLFTSINLDKLEASLTGTLNKNNCKLKY